MKFLLPGEGYPESHWIGYDHDKNINHLRLKECRKLISPERLHYSIKENISIGSFRKYDYLLSDGVDLLSESLADFLSSQAKDDIQLVPAIIMAGRLALEGYFALNCLSGFEAFDKIKSKSEPLIDDMPDGPRDFTKIILLDTEPPVRIFRDSETMANVIVSNDLAEKIEEKNFKGLRFSAGRGF